MSSALLDDSPCPPRIDDLVGRLFCTRGRRVDMHLRVLGRFVGRVDAGDRRCGRVSVNDSGLRPSVRSGFSNEALFTFTASTQTSGVPPRYDDTLIGVCYHDIGHDNPVDEFTTRPETHAQIIALDDAEVKVDLTDPDAAAGREQSNRPLLVGRDRAELDGHAEFIGCDESLSQLHRRGRPTSPRDSHDTQSRPTTENAMSATLKVRSDAASWENSPGTPARATAPNTAHGRFLSVTITSAPRTANATMC